MLDSIQTKVSKREVKDDQWCQMVKNLRVNKPPTHNVTVANCIRCSFSSTIIAKRTSFKLPIPAFEDQCETNKLKRSADTGNLDLPQRKEGLKRIKKETNNMPRSKADAGAFLGDYFRDKNLRTVAPKMKKLGTAYGNNEGDGTFEEPIEKLLIV